MNNQPTSFDVRIWKTDVYEGKTKKTYWVRWRVAAERFKVPFTTRALAESFRSDLLAAARKGEAFRVSDGMPVSMARQTTDETSWYEFACWYVDMKWPNAAATYRRLIAETLAAVTPVMVKDMSGRPSEKRQRSALNRWAFNVQHREDGKPEYARDALQWIERSSLPLSAVMRPDIARALHDSAVSRTDGKPLARSVARQRRMIVNNALNYAVEQGLISENPVKAVKWTAPKPSRAIDSRRVANPVQARTLLRYVAEVQRSGPLLVACLAAMYFAALRPEEALNLRESNLTLPRPEWNPAKGEWLYGWGKVYIEEATPHAGSAWTDSRKPRDRRGLKHRERGEGRHVPCPPELTAALLQHLDSYGTDADGQLFRGERGGEVPRITWDRVWKAALKATFTKEAAATPLAATPYDLRHAAVSTWLNGGVPPTTVAEWAGHSVQVLLEVYAKCLDGQDHTARQQVQRALGHT